VQTKTNPNGTVTMENARIVFRNFAGLEGPYNQAGDRNFSVVLDDELADLMESDGWNVKRKPPREEGEDPFNHLQITVGYKGRSTPRIVLIGSQTHKRTVLDQDTCDLVDWADIQIVDLVIRPYSWSVNGKSGIKAYLKTMFVTINEDPLEVKYAEDSSGQDPGEGLDE